jgi:hypothetical protein
MSAPTRLRLPGDEPHPRRYLALGSYRGLAPLHPDGLSILAQAHPVVPRIRVFAILLHLTRL